MWLDSETFRTVVSSTPLISIDFVVQNSNGEILLGQRLNRPAEGFWFVPGGRILKNETLDDAFERLTLQELGLSFSRKGSRLLNVYEHFYEDSIFGGPNDGPTTHYVVLGYHIKLAANLQLAPPLIQHDTYRWFKSEETQNTEVHENTRVYMDALTTTS